MQSRLGSAVLLVAGMSVAVLCQAGGQERQEDMIGAATALSTHELVLTMQSWCATRQPVYNGPIADAVRSWQQVNRPLMESAKKTLVGMTPAQSRSLFGDFMKLRADMLGKLEKSPPKQQAQVCMHVAGWMWSLDIPSAQKRAVAIYRTYQMGLAQKDGPVR